MIDYSDLEKLIDDCFDEMSDAARAKYDSDKADRTAALFLTAQMKVSFFIEEVEMKARHAKNEITRLEGEKYFEFKSRETEKKTTENMATSFISKSPDIVTAKNEHAQHESSLKKWNYVLGTLKDAHVYFRNLAKNKTWAE